MEGAVDRDIGEVVLSVALTAPVYVSPDIDLNFFIFFRMSVATNAEASLGRPRSGGPQNKGISLGAPASAPEE